MGHLYQVYACTNGILMLNPWAAHGTALQTHGKPVVAHGSPMGRLWVTRGPLMRHPWVARWYVYIVSAMGLPWVYSGGPWAAHVSGSLVSHLCAMRLPRVCHGYHMVIPWVYSTGPWVGHEVSMDLTWAYSAGSWVTHGSFTGPP